jgi:RNA polymerase sigma factor (sigma-70 family)
MPDQAPDKVPDGSQADRYLIKKISAGDADGWSQLIDRYQGRLLAFARGRLPSPSDAEDLVQETFVGFLQQIKSFRPGASIETYLFTILRRRIIDVLRSRGSRTVSLNATDDESSYGDAAERLPGRDMTASWYVRRDEGANRLREALAAGLNGLVSRLKTAGNFRDLKVVEMLFYSQMRNKDAARISGLDEKQIALIKHRCLNEIRDNVAKYDEARGAGADPSGKGGGEPGELRDRLTGIADSGASLLTDVWEEYRPACPKRSTIGRFLLGTLDEPWQEYVEFHLNQLKCEFCNANLADLQKQESEQPKKLHDRVYQSTIGFFQKPPAQ